MVDEGVCIGEGGTWGQVRRVVGNGSGSKRVRKDEPRSAMRR